MSNTPDQPHRRTRTLHRVLNQFAVVVAVACSPGAATISPGAEATNKPGAKFVDLFGDEVLVKAKGFEITRSRFEQFLADYRSAAAVRSQPLPNTRPGELEGMVLDRLILNQMLLLKATDDDRAKAKEARDRVVAETKRLARSEESFRRQLLVAGMTPLQYEERVMEQSTCERVMDRLVRSKIEIGPEQVRDFYEKGIDPQARELQNLVDRLAKTGSNTVFYSDAKKKLEEVTKANLGRLEFPEEVRASHILFYTVNPRTQEELSYEEKKAKREVATNLIERLRQGADFADLAIKYSDDPQVQENKGEYVARRDTEMAPEVRNVLFSMSSNQVSDLVVAPYGYHILKLHERIPAGKRPLDKVSNTIKEYLLDAEFQARLPACLTELKKEFGVQLVLPTEAK